MLKTFKEKLLKLPFEIDCSCHETGLCADVSSNGDSYNIEAYIYDNKLYVGFLFMGMFFKGRYYPSEESPFRLEENFIANNFDDVEDIISNIEYTLKESDFKKRYSKMYKLIESLLEELSEEDKKVAEYIMNNYEIS